LETFEEQAPVQCKGLLLKATGQAQQPFSARFLIRKGLWHGETLVRLKKVAWINAVGFFAFWLLVLLAGADKPPSVGFLWIVLVVALSAMVVYRRVPTYLQWYQTKEPRRLLRLALEGFLAGLVVATPFALLGGDGSSTAMRPIAYVIWFAILGFMGMLNSVTLYVINAALAKRLDSE
jgi:hypothetical protein